MDRREQRLRPGISSAGHSTSAGEDCCSGTDGSQRRLGHRFVKPRAAFRAAHSATECAWSWVRVAAILALLFPRVRLAVQLVGAAMFKVNRGIDFVVVHLLHYAGAAVGVLGGAAYGVVDAVQRHDLHALLDDAGHGAEVGAHLAEERLARPVCCVAEAVCWAAATGVAGGAAAAAEAARLAAIASGAAQVAPAPAPAPRARSERGPADRFAPRRQVTCAVAPVAAADAGAALQQLAELHPPHTPVGDLSDLVIPGSRDLCDRAVQYLITRWSIHSAEAEHELVEARERSRAPRHGSHAHAAEHHHAPRPHHAHSPAAAHHHAHAHAAAGRPHVLAAGEGHPAHRPFRRHSTELRGCGCAGLEHHNHAAEGLAPAAAA
eukprot:tig00020704_g13154.t1